MANRQKLISQHNLLYETAPSVWQDGFPIGNGHFGALVYQPQGIEFAISKLDVWDRRADCRSKIPFDRIREIADENPEQVLRELATERPSNKDLMPAPKPCGKLNISIDDWIISPLHTIFKQQQELSLYEGTVKGEYELASKSMQFESFVYANDNILIIKMSDNWVDKRLCCKREEGFCYEQTISLSRDIDNSLGQPTTGYDNEIAWIRYKFPDGFEYVMAMMVKGVRLSEPEIYPDSVNIKAMLEYSKGEKYSYSIYLTVVTSMDSVSPMKTAKQKLMRAMTAGYDKIKHRHDKWWQNFWDSSAIELENKFLEGLWYYSLYQFASTSRGDVAPGLFGLWNACKTVPWSGDYHGDINMAMTYWPIFSSNHLELGEPFFKTFEKIAKIAKHQTKELYQIDGLKFPIATLDTGIELCSGYYRMMQCTTAFYGLLFWNYYLYTQNKKILKEQVFDILEEGSKFYLALTKQDGESILLGPSWAPEQGPFPAYNTNNDIGLIKPLWQAYIDACHILNIKSGIKNKIEKYLKKFPDYPQKNGEFLDSLTASKFIGLNHPGLLAMVVPGQDVDAESSLAETARKTMRKYLERTNRKSFSDRTSSACDLTWPWLLSVATKLRDIEFAEHILMDIGIGEFLKPNGMFAWIGGGLFRTPANKKKAYSRKIAEIALHGLFSLSSTKKGKELCMSMLQQASGYIYAINEMLMQSHSQIIRIFPAVPKCLGDCAFENLRAEGSFLVSAGRKKGKTLQISINSLAGKKCRLKIYDNPDLAEIKLKTAKNRKITAKRIAEKTWEFNTKKGEKYFWSQSGHGKCVEVASSNIYGVKQITDIRGNIISYGRKGYLFEVEK